MRLPPLGRLGLLQPKRRAQHGRRSFPLPGRLIPGPASETGCGATIGERCRQEGTEHASDRHDKQILDSLDRLSPRGRREAVLRLVAGASALDRIVERSQPQIIALAAQRGLDWARLSDEERERLVDDILHE